jgi:hypothetical protein
VAILIGLALAHAWRVPHHAGDDELWRAHASAGLTEIWTQPSPFRHFRPAFGTWLWVLLKLGVGSPTGLAVATLALFLAGGALAFWAFRPLLEPPFALLASTLVLIHPARQQQLFWTSAGIDALGLLLSLVAIGLALRLYRRDSVSPIVLGFVALSTALAVLSKEIALALPGILVLLPGSATAVRRLAVGGASAGGAAVAAAAWLAVIGGGGRPAGMVPTLGSPAALLYPSRLVWPGDFHDWAYQAKLDGGVAAPLAVAAVTAAAVVVLALASRGRAIAPVAYTGLLLAGAGWLPWLIRQDDRAIGLGVVGIALLIAGAVRFRSGARPWLGPTVVIVLALAWSPLWVRWEARWLEASRLSGRIVHSWQAWRADESTGALLVAIGAPSMVGWTCEITGVGEVDPCGLDLFAVLGPSPAPPVETALDGVSGLLHVSTTGGSVLRWGQQPAPSLGVVLVETDRGYARAAVLDPEPLQQVAKRLGCVGVDLRRWNAGEFVPIDREPATPRYPDPSFR